LIALRKIRDPKVWTTKLERDADATAANPPMAMLAELTPSLEEIDHVSIFVVHEEEEAAAVAGALAMVSSTGPRRTVFAQASMEALIASGLKLEDKAGETLVSPVDELHKNLCIPDHGTLAIVAGHFINPRPIIVEVDEVRRAIQTLVQAGHYDFAEIASARGKSLNRAICDSALSLVATKHFTVQTREPTAA
jgi:hypothetical protein